MSNNISISTDYLKNNCKRIYWFGLGFIQVVVSDDVRYHFYVDSLPTIEESPHNHRYNFTSFVCKGAFTQTFYKEDIKEKLFSKKFDIFEESCKSGSTEQFIKTLWLSESSKHSYLQGSSYHIKYDEFHTVEAQNKTITRITRGVIQQPVALVARLSGTPKQCPFEVKVPEPTLWEIIDDCLSN